MQRSQLTRLFEPVNTNQVCLALSLVLFKFR
jgi:hypothetical protein